MKRLIIVLFGVLVFQGSVWAGTPVVSREKVREVREIIENTLIEDEKFTRVLIERFFKRMINVIERGRPKDKKIVRDFTESVMTSITNAMKDERLKDTKFVRVFIESVDAIHTQSEEVTLSLLEAVQASEVEKERQNDHSDQFNQWLSEDYAQIQALTSSLQEVEARQTNISTQQVYLLAVVTELLATVSALEAHSEYVGASAQQLRHVGEGVKARGEVESSCLQNWPHSDDSVTTARILFPVNEGEVISKKSSFGLAWHERGVYGDWLGPNVNIRLFNKDIATPIKEFNNILNTGFFLINKRNFRAVKPKNEYYFEIQKAGPTGAGTKIQSGCFTFDVKKKEDLQCDNASNMKECIKVLIVRNTQILTHISNINDRLKALEEGG